MSDDPSPERRARRGKQELEALKQRRATSRNAGRARLRDDKPRPGLMGAVRDRYASTAALGSSAGTVGMEMVLSVLFGLFVGRWLDGKWGTSPYLGIFGFGLGVAAAVRALLRAMRQMQREAEKEEREQGNPAPLFESTSEREARKKKEDGFLRDRGGGVARVTDDGEPVDPEAPEPEGSKP